MAKCGLIVSYYFPPAGGGGVQRWSKYIKYLSRLGWRFTVVCAPAEQSSLQDKTLLDDLPDTTRIISVPGRTKHPSFQRNKTPRYFKRWLSAAVYITDSRKKWNKIAAPVIKGLLAENHFDAIIITIPPYSLAGLAVDISELSSVPVLLDMRDPWTRNPYKIYPTVLHYYFDRKREEKAINRIQYLISAYRSTISYLGREEPGPTQNPTTLYLPNGYDEEDFQDLRPAPLPNPGTFNIGFSGTFYSHLNHPANLFAAIKLVQQCGIDIRFYHIGTAAYNLKKLAKKHGITKNYHNLGYVSHRENLQYLLAMDATCFILSPQQKNADKTVGGKVYEYLRIKKPILAIVPENGEAARLINETDAGPVCASDDPAAIADKLMELVTDKNRYTFINIDSYERKRQALELNRFIEGALV